MSDFDPDCTREGVFSQPAGVHDYLFVVVRCLSNVLEEIAEGVSMVSNLLAAHANWRRDQKVFQAEAAQAIEQITGGAP